MRTYCQCYNRVVCCQNKDDVLLWAQDNITVVDVITQDVTLVLEPPSDTSAYSFTPTQASRRQLVIRFL